MGAKDVADSMPIDLVEAVRSGDAVVFCGAGLSALAGTPTATELAHILIVRLDRYDGDPHDLTAVATAYAAERGRHALIQSVLDSFRQRCVAPTATHRVLCRLPFAAFVTSNWDNLLEQALQSVGRKWMQLVTDQQLP